MENEETVQGLYQFYLFREADDEGLAFFSAALDAGASPRDIVNDLQATSEGAIAALTAIYQGMLGRAPEQGGLDYWVPLILSGSISLEDVVQTFAAEAEFQARWAPASSLEPTELVEILYQTMLGREPDDEGVAYWLSVAEQGNLTNLDLIFSFAAQPEFQALAGDELRPYLNDAADGELSSYPGSLIVDGDGDGAGPTDPDPTDPGEEPGGGGGGGGGDDEDPADPTFVISESEGVVSFSGSATGEISLVVFSDSEGSTTVQAQRGGILSNTLVVEGFQGFDLDADEVLRLSPDQADMLAVTGEGSVVVSGSLAEDFDEAVTLSATQEAGAWYTDRFAPDRFESIEQDGENVLLLGISAEDDSEGRGNSFSSAFYNTQGRKLDLPTETSTVSIDLFISEEWQPASDATTGERWAGFWATGFDDAGAVAAYPILEFETLNGTAGFRGYDTSTGAWIDLGLPDDFAYGEFYTLEIALNEDGSYTYSVGDLAADTPASSSSAIGNVILQGYNSDDGRTYEIVWDNLMAGPDVFIDEDTDLSQIDVSVEFDGPPVFVAEGASLRLSEEQMDDSVEGADGGVLNVLGDLTIAGEISTNTDEDFYTLSLKAGQTITFDVDNADLGEGTLDAVLGIFDSQDNFLDFDDDDDDNVGDNSGARQLDPYLVFTAEDDGEYTLSVGSYLTGSSGTYDLSITSPEIFGLA